jgi:hypothetical protein
MLKATERGVNLIFLVHHDLGKIWTWSEEILLFLSFHIIAYAQIWVIETKFFLLACLTLLGPVSIEKCYTQTVENFSETSVFHVALCFKTYDDFFYKLLHSYDILNYSQCGLWIFKQFSNSLSLDQKHATVLQN